MLLRWRNWHSISDNKMAWFSDWMNSNYRAEAFLAFSVLERSRFMAFHMTCTRKRRDGWQFVLILASLRPPYCFFPCQLLKLCGRQESKINFQLSIFSPKNFVAFCENAESRVLSFVIIKVLLHFWRSAYQQGSNLCITAATGDRRVKKISRVSEFITYC